MKRYWKLILLVLFVIASLSTFYLSGASAGSHVPQFKIETISGDESVTTNMVIEGEYQPEAGMGGEILKITGKGTQTYRDYSYFDRIDGKFDNSQIAKYQEKYKSFMRGTGSSLANFYEDENRLLFAGEQLDYSRASLKVALEVKVLDKETEETEKFTVDVPDRFEYFYVENVYLEDSRLFVSAQARPYGDAASAEGETYFVYEIDTKKQAIVNGEDVTAPYKEGEFDHWYTYIWTDSGMESGRYSVAQIQGEKYDSNGNSEDSEEIVVVYDLVTGKSSVMELDDIEADLSYTMGVHQDSIYRHYQQEDEWVIERYDAESKEKLEEYSLTLDESFDEKMNSQIKFSDGKAYVVYGNPEDRSIKIDVIDLLSGEHIYKGSVEATGKLKPKSNSSLEFYGFEVY